MAAYFGSACLSMKLLDQDKGWDLFRKLAFGQQGRIPPPELEKIGKEIVKKCKGLPLSITVIGGLLGKSSMALEYWENVAEDINSILNSGDDEHCLNILSLSYTHLPAHLKPCFLYMGVFPEDHEIRVSRLIKLWVAEGFLKPNETESLEKIAESYIMDLFGRNLIFARRWGASGKLKVCSIHDLLRDLCLRIAEKEKFLRVINTFSNNITGDMKRDRRLVLNGYFSKKDYRPDALEPLARSLICGEALDAPLKFRLLRVLDNVCFHNVENICEQGNMRYLAFRRHNYPPAELFSSIFLLWNLQTLICPGGSFVAPVEIWELPLLRHVEFQMIHLPDPPSGRQHEFVLQNLQTLKRVVDLRLSEELCRRIPNVRNLSLRYEDEFQVGSLGQLDKLTSFSLFFRSPPNREDLVRNLKLPSSLQKLTLRGCELGWEDLSVIGSLPNLHVLQLDRESVDGSEWNPIEGQFLGLKCLRVRILCCSLIRWNADSFHFPVLETLHLEGITELEEIPIGMGEIPTLLRLIHLVGCSDSCAISALQILEEQESQGNAEGLQVQIQFWDEATMESFKEKVEYLSSNVKLGYDESNI